MSVHISATRRVVCIATIHLPMSSGAAWGQLRHFQTSATHDPFHAAVEIEGEVPRAGASLRIEHRYLLVKTTRVGRILRWREGSGFAFSDLCESNAKHAFPHVISYQLISTAEKSCQLRIRVTGRWTAPIPRWIGRMWLWWVFSHVVRTVRNQLLAYAFIMQRRK